jgi:Zn-dependent peptidase ImmA (M78 family)
VIELCLRYKTDDEFWFSFFHEAGHLLLDDRKSSRIGDLNGDSLAEARADDFAANLLIPPAGYASFSPEGTPGRIEVLEFAAQIDIAPGIVVGRLQRDESIPQNWLNDLKVKLEWLP